MLKAGFYEKEITAPLGLGMPGGFANNPSTTILERLYAKAAAFNVGEKTVIVIAMDMLKASKHLCDGVTARITELTGIPYEDILICATHTHSGIPIPGVRLETSSVDENYESYLERITADAGILAYQRMKPVTVKYNSSREEGLTFNRNYVMKDGTVRTNPGWKNPDIVKPFGPVDDEFSTLFFYDGDKPIAAIANFACHNCSTGTSGNISSDFAGALSNNLKDEYGNDFITLFFAGACGNLNHCDFINSEWSMYRHKFIGRQLADAAIRHNIDSVEVKVDSIDSLKENVYVSKQKLDEVAIEEYRELYRTMPFGSYKVDISKPESKEFKRGKAPTYINIADMPEPIPCCIQSVKLGEAVIFAYPCELYTEYGLEMKAKSPAKYNFITTLANGSLCYVPIPEARGTNIYEAQLTSAFLEDNAGSIFVEKALEQAEKLTK